MIKTLARQIKEYKRASLVTPIFMILEVAMEMVIPLLMASIIDDGVQAGDMNIFLSSVVIWSWQLLSDCSPVSWVVNTVRKHPPDLPET